MSSRKRYKKFGRASLLGEKCLVTSLWSIFQILGNQSELERTARPPKIFVDVGVSF